MPAQTSRKLSRAEIANAMRKAGWPESAIPVGVAVALAESGGNPSAVNHSNRNGSKDYGLFQINSVHKELLAKHNWSDPVDNARMALSVYKGAGNKWTPWSVYKSGSYLKFYTGKADGDPTTEADDDKGDSFADGLKDGLLGGASGATNVGLFTLGYLGDRAFWVRFGIGLLAVGLIIAGIVIIFRQPLTDVGKGIANLHPVGRAATIGGALKGATK